jgi:HSP20 family molecular chaperone IbpA
MEDMESMLESVLSDFETMDRFMNPPRGWGAFEPTPALDMHEGGDSYTVVFTVPGLDADSIRVEIEGRTLSVVGSPLVVAGRAAPRRFESRVRLPGPVGDIDKAEAVLTNGLLRVSLPKAFPSPAANSEPPVFFRLR